jgi:type 1 fimbria pilin
MADKGTVMMSGQIQHAACNLSTVDAWHEIDFGIIGKRRTIDASEYTTIPVSLLIKDCDRGNNDDNFWHSLEITFNGTISQRRQDLFQLRGEGTGLALRLTDYYGNQVLPDKPQSFFRHQLRDNKLDFYLSVISDGMPISERAWFGAVRFMLDYK